MKDEPRDWETHQQLSVHKCSKGSATAALGFSPQAAAAVLFLQNVVSDGCLLSVCRWTVSMAGSVAGGGEARRGESMPQAVCVLPYAHDGQLPVAEHHHSSGWRPLQLAARFPAEQPHHGVTHRLLRL